MNQPSSILVRPRAAQEATDDDLEYMEEAADMGRAARRAAARTNKVASFLGQSFWRTDKTWPFLWWPTAGVQLSVEMYFPGLNLAVDRFRSPTTYERQEAAYKSMKLKEHGIKYKALFPENRLAELKETK